MFGQAAFSADMLEPAGRAGRRQPALRARVRADADRAGRAAPVRPRLVAGRSGSTCRCPTASTRSSPTGSTCSTPTDRAVLQAAAVVGMHFWPGAVGRGAGPPRRRRSSARCAGWSSATSCTSRPTSTMAGQAGVPLRPRAGPRRLLPAAAAHRAGRPARAHRRLARRASPQPRHRPGRGARPPPLGGPRDRPHARRRPGPVRRPGPRRRCTGPPAARTPCTPSTPPPTTWSARSRWPTSRTRPSSLQLELLRTEISFYRDRDEFLTGGGPDQLVALADRLYAARRRRAGAPAPGPCSARPPGCAPTAGPRCPAWTARSSCSTGCPTRPRRPTPTPSWAGCTCSTTSATRRSPRPARPPRSPSGWATSRRGPTPGSPSAMARYQAGDRGGAGRAVRGHRVLPHPPAARADPGHPEPRRTR